MFSQSGYLWLKIIIIYSIIITNHYLVWADEYTFCSDNLSYTFSTDACPGGVLLKQPLTITEPCHCFDGDLKIYPSCGVGSHVTKFATPEGCSKPIIDVGGQKWNGEVMLLLPAQMKASNNTTELDLCYEMPKYCIEKEENAVLSVPETLKKAMMSITKSTTAISKNISETETTTITSSSLDGQAEAVLPVTVKTDNGSSTTSSTSESDEDYYSEEYDYDGTTTMSPTSATMMTTTPTKTTTTTLKPSIKDLGSNSNSFGIEYSNPIPTDTENSVNEQSTINSNINHIPNAAELPMDAYEDQNDLNSSVSEKDEDTRLTSQKIDLPMVEESSGESNKIDLPVEDGKSTGNKPRSLAEIGENTGNSFMDNFSLMRHITGVKEGLIPNPPPNTKTFQMIKESIRIAQKLIPNNVMKDVHLDEAYLAFRHLFQHIDEDMKIDRHLNIEDFNTIMLVLDSCHNNAPTLAFKSKGWPRQIQHFYIMQSSGAAEAHPKIPTDRTHQPDHEDYIVGIMWKVIDIVHSACFHEFRLNDPSSQFNYLVSIENVFFRSEIQKRWYQPQLVNKETGKKLNLVTHPNIKIFMQNLDAIDAAVHSISGFKYFLRKPYKSSLDNSNDPSSSWSSPNEPEKRNKRQLTANLLDEVKNDKKYKKKHHDNDDHGAGGTRRKRQNRITVLDPTAYEIWGGKAFCLQKNNPKLPASVLNAVPRVRDLCKQIKQTSS